MSRRNDRHATRERKQFLNRLVLRLLERGPNDPTAGALGQAIAESLRDKNAAAGATANGVEDGSQNGYRVGNRHAEV